MKKYLLSILGLIFVCFLNGACSEVNDNMSLAEKFPLTAFSVKIGNKYYHADIDQDVRKASIGAIENANLITGVEYTLMSDGASITPTPETFLGKWQREQEMTVTTHDGKKTTYIIEFTNLKAESSENILFYDDFEEDGPLNSTYWYSFYLEKPVGGQNKPWVQSSEYAYVENGNLKLIADKVNGMYRQGRVETRDKFNFTFGEVEVRARITRHPDGNFPAIWMMPHKVRYPESGINTNPISGEVDIMEHVKQNQNIHQTLHSNYTFNLKITDPINTVTVPCNVGEYHLYGLKWTDDEVIFYLDGQETLRYPNLRLSDEATVMQWPFSSEAAFYLILNMSLSNGDNTWVGPIDDGGLPAIMEVDYVKVKTLDE